VALTAGLATAACAGSTHLAASTDTPAASAAPARPASSGTASSGTASSGSASSGAGLAAATPPAARSRVRLAVRSGAGGAPFNVPRVLTLPDGWTAQVWARVPGARMAAWTPSGRLLVSVPGAGRVVELTPRAGRAATVTTLLSGLTSPQGLAFARVGGREVLYVGESHEIDRYPWHGNGVGRARTVIAGGLPDMSPAGDDIHREKDVAVAPDGTVYFDVGSSSNASPADRTYSPPRAVIMAVDADGHDLRVVEKGVRNGEGLATAPDGVVWTAVNNRDNIPYPFHGLYDGGRADPFGEVIPAYVNNHPPDEVVPVTAGRDLGWPYCNPDQDESHPRGSLASVPFAADSVTNPNGGHLNCAALPPVEVGLPAHSAPLGMSFLEHTKIPAPWSGGAVIAAHGSWNRTPPRAPAVLWLGWDAARRTLEPAVTLAGGFQEADGSRWGRPADAVPGPDGALYVTDDTAGAVYRLMPPG
jgi:glucose/arabinose dehydrogenase